MMTMSFFSSLLLLVGCCSQAKAFTTLAATARISGQRTTTVHVATDITTPIDDAPITQDSQSRPPREQRRILGSQENLMLPRQYSPGKDVFPQMNHVCVAVLSSTPSEQVLRQAIDETMAAHPFLRCKIDGDGEPDERIDLFQMVRKGEPNPCTFSSNGPGQFTSRDVLQVIDVLNDDDRVALYASWKTTFSNDIDDGSWCNSQKGPLWKVEWHRTNEDVTDKSCALVFSFNHAISDQSSTNRLVDMILGNMAAIERDGSVQNKPVEQHMPVSVEESVLGLNKRWADVELKGVTPGTIAYVAGKAAEGFKTPVILPDSEDNGSSILGALSIITGKAAGGEDEGNETRRSALQFRTLSSDTVIALLAKCRENSVSISNALTAAMTLTSTDFVAGGLPSNKSRNYKILQSLDLRRFGAQLDKGETFGCLAGSMDLIYGPLADHAGEALRRDPNPQRVDEFWKLAQSGLDQTNAFVASDGPKHAMRVFDFAMTVADLNNLVYLTAQSKDSKGRAYSAGVTNNGVYERQEAFQRKDDERRPWLRSQHGRYKIEDLYYGVSHARSGCLYQLSCLTIGGEMKLTFHPAMPIVSEETNAEFADAFVEMIETIICEQ